MRWRRQAVALAVTLVLLGAACGGSNGGAPERGTPDRSDPAVEPAADPERFEPDVEPAPEPERFDPFESSFPRTRAETPGA